MIILSVEILAPTTQTIELAVQKLIKHELIGLPTETVYGLAADAASPQAVNKIFKAKDRPNDHPLIVHVRGVGVQNHSSQAWIEILMPWAREIPPPAIALAMNAWPGPLTMILPRARGVIDEVTGGQDTVGIRCPNHPVAQAVLVKFQGGLAAPSANRFGRISPTTAEHVKDEFTEHLDDLLILDGGPCAVGIESTIVDLCHWDTQGPIILRPGVITRAQIESWTGLVVGQKPALTTRHSGGMAAHYAPRTRLLLADDLHAFELSGGKTDFKKIAWVGFNKPAAIATQANIEFIQFPKEPQVAAKVLYDLLRQLDKQSYELLVFPDLPDEEVWSGIKDRLNRAAVGSGV